ncbi:MAG: ISAs1 family transposase [Anaerolineales bacterium]|nr:ISAs1 family transposase [Anaerolineales bacterium]
MNVEEIPKNLHAYFESLEDQRRGAGKRHKLIEVITIAICGIICGADDWSGIEEYGKAKEEWLRQFLALPHGIPSHDTFGRIFSWLEPQAFEKSFLSWVQAVMAITSGQVIAIDGKTLRRSHDRTNGKEAIHMVSAWAEKNHLVLAQVKVDEKSNEITAIPELLRVLALKGCIVTTDAMGCQQEIAAIVVEKGGDYLLAVKENQGQLYQDIGELFDGAEEVDFFDVEHTHAKTTNKNHGRIEVRKCWAVTEPDFIHYLRGLENWKNLRTLVKVTCQRQTATGTTQENRFFISSLHAPAKQLLKAVRGHWSIENGLHWVLDVAFREDECRVRKEHAPENLAVLRHIALNLLKQDTTIKRGIKNKRLVAAWNNDYLIHLFKG